MARIEIISGFLGAGKTTLIRKLLKEAFTGGKSVLIENEFGEIAVDGAFLKDSGIQIRELNSGCICCSLFGDFGVALKDVEEQYHPDRIIIEPSGVGKLSDVIRAAESAVSKEHGLILNSFTTIVDATKCKLYLDNFGEFFSNQIKFAGTLILSRTDKASKEQIDSAYSIIREINSTAPVITTPISLLTGTQILEVMEQNNTLEKDIEMLLKVEGEENHEHHHDEHDHEHEHHHHHDHDADEIFVSWGCETNKEYSYEKLERILASLENDDTYGIVLRAKGMVPDEEGVWHHFDMVPGEAEIREGTAEYTGRICVIGSRLKEENIAELFGL